MVKPRSAKAKGTKLERWVAQELTRAGIRATRQPGSGAFSGFPHDVTLRDFAWIIECKARREGLKTLDRWMGAAEILIIKADRQPPNVYMNWPVFVDLMQRAQACPEFLEDAKLGSGNPTC